MATVLDGTDFNFSLDRETPDQPSKSTQSANSAELSIAAVLAELSLARQAKINADVIATYVRALLLYSIADVRSAAQELAHTKRAVGETTFPDLPTLLALVRSHYARRVAPSDSPIDCPLCGTSSHPGQVAVYGDPHVLRSGKVQSISPVIAMRPCPNGPHRAHTQSDQADYWRRLEIDKRENSSNYPPLPDELARIFGRR
jgi:hypothetical protein